MTNASSAYPSSDGIHFKEPWEFPAYAATAANLNVYDSGAVQRTSATTNFFTEMARRGLQDTTNWTANTYKTLLSVSSGKGLVSAVIGCTAGGSETTTIEFTVDGGAAVEIAVAVASGQRAALIPILGEVAFFTGTDTWKPSAEALVAGKNQFSESITNAFILPWSAVHIMGVPCLKFKKSLLIRAKHSTDITNSTATAYSGIQYRLGL